MPGQFGQSKIVMFCKFLRDDYEGEKRMDDINSSKFPVGLTLAVCMKCQLSARFSPMSGTE